MFGISKLYAMIGFGIAFALLAAWGLRVDNLRDGWRTRYITETGEVTATIRRVTNNNKFQWKDASQQIEALAVSRESWKTVAGEQTAAIDALGAESERLKALNAELRAKAKAEIAKRNRLIDRLENAALTPGDATNVQEQLAACVAALNMIYEEGL